MKSTKQKNDSLKRLVKIRPLVQIEIEMVQITNIKDKKREH